MTKPDGKFGWLKPVVSLALGAGLGSLYVSTYFPPENSTFHSGQLAESVVIVTLLSLACFLCVQAISLFADFRKSEHIFLRAWLIAFFFCVAIFVVSSAYFGYLGFIDSARDWGKNHNSFEFNAYVIDAISGGVLFGSIFAVIPFAIASLSIGGLAMIALRKEH